MLKEKVPSAVVAASTAVANYFIRSTYITYKFIGLQRM